MNWNLIISQPELLSGADKMTFMTLGKKLKSPLKIYTPYPSIPTLHFLLT